MAQKQCGKCGEIVDEAKAFCPGCGNAFVQEEGREATRFEKMDNTVQLGQTMYNQMLSDMGLSGDIKGIDNKYIEAEQPAVLAPIEPNNTAVPPSRTKRPSVVKWVILAAVIFAVGFLLLLVAIVLIYFFWPRIG